MASKTWKEAFFTSPGPRTRKEALGLMAKGVCMGAADIIPGVSGGTIALITGIYHNFLKAIKSFNREMGFNVLKGRFKEALEIFHARFLITLVTGILISIVALSRVIHFLLNNYKIEVGALFFGLIAASILIVGRKVENWIGQPALGFLFGAAGAYFFVGMIPVETPESYAFIFLSGVVAICAMILPGVSGAFLLLVLGKYEFITGALKEIWKPQNLLIVLVFEAGCIVGIVGFSRVVSNLLDRYYNVTLAILTGLMCGSMRKIWPWKEVLEERVIRGKTHIISEKNVFPPDFGGEFFIALGSCVLGFILVLLLDRIAGEDGKDHE